MNAGPPLLIALALIGCRPADGPSSAPELSTAGGAAIPPPSLAPKLSRFQALAAKRPPPPDEESRQAVLGLVEAAFASDADPDLTRPAERVLLRHEHVAFALTESLLHQDPAVRARAAWQLGQLGLRVAIPDLLWRVRFDVNPDVRLWMADALARLGSYARLDVVRDSLDDARFAERAAALVVELAAKAELEVPASPTWDQIREHVDRQLRSWKRTGVPMGETARELTPEMEAIYAHHVAALTEFQLKPVDQARTALSNVGVEPLPLLIEALSAEETYLRYHAVEVVRDIGRPAAAAGDSLVSLLGDPVCRTVALEALGAIGYSPSAEAVVGLLDHGEPDVRAAAAGALGPMGATSAAASLRARMDDPAEEATVRVFAAFSLALLTPDGGEGRAFLEARSAAADYHAPTLTALLERLDAGE